MSFAKPIPKSTPKMKPSRHPEAKTEEKGRKLGATAQSTLLNPTSSSVARANVKATPAKVTVMNSTTKKSVSNSVSKESKERSNALEELDDAYTAYLQSELLKLNALDAYYEKKFHCEKQCTMLSTAASDATKELRELQFMKHKHHFLEDYSRGRKEDIDALERFKNLLPSLQGKINEIAKTLDQSLNFIQVKGINLEEELSEKVVETLKDVIKDELDDVRSRSEEVSEDELTTVCDLLKNLEACLRSAPKLINECKEMRDNVLRLTTKEESLKAAKEIDSIKQTTQSDIFQTLLSKIVSNRVF